MLLFLLFDTCWCQHELSGVIFALGIEIDGHHFPGDVLALETGVEQVWDLRLDEHLLNALFGGRVLALEQLAPRGQVAKGENAADTKETEGMSLELVGQGLKVIKLTLIKSN